jgi:hypothetical protein
VERKELIKILKDAGIAEDVFEQYVNLQVRISGMDGVFYNRNLYQISLENCTT